MLGVGEKFGAVAYKAYRGQPFPTQIVLRSKKPRCMVAKCTEPAIMLPMTSLNQLSRLTKEQFDNELMNQAHNAKVMNYIDNGLPAAEAISRADDEMFALITSGDPASEIEQEDYLF